MSNDLRSLIKNCVILIVTIFVAYLLSYQGGEFYKQFFDAGSSFIDATALVGLPLTYIFFLVLLFTAFGGKKKYWLIGILLIPAAVAEVYLDLEHIYFPIIIGLVGFLIGQGIKLIITKLNPLK